MNWIVRLVGMALGVWCMGLSTGCISHRVAADYGKYLANNQGRTPLPHTQVVAEYALTPQTAAHRLQFRSAMAGFANKWVVEFGQMLQTTLESHDVQDAFQKLTKSAGQAGQDALLLTFHLQEYRFEGFTAKVALRISVARNGSPVFTREYVESGASQGGKVANLGVFGMKNAIQQSTKTAVDAILTRFLTDLSAEAKR